MSETQKLPFPLKIKQEIKDIKEEQTEQNTKIQENANNIADYNKAMLALQAELLATRKDLEAGTLEGQDTGESLYLADSSDARFRKFNIEGNSKQETREESNLYDKSTNTTSKGVDIDGVEYDASGWALTDYIPILAVNKLLKYSGLTAVGNKPHSAFYNKDKEFISSFKQAVGENTIEIPENASYVRFTIEIASGDINTFNISYVAMPSLEFPSPIQAVGQDVNLLNIEELVAGYVNDVGTFNLNGNNGEKRSSFIKVKPKQTLTFKIIETTDMNANWISVGEYSNNNVSSFVRRKSADKAELTFTTGETTEYVIVSARNLQNATKVILKEGNGDMKWSPYNHGSANVVACNKNFFDKNEVVWEAGKRVNPDTGNLESVGSLEWSSTQNYISVPSNTKLHFKGTVCNVSWRFYMHTYNANKQFIKTIELNSGSETRELTFNTEEARFVRFTFNVSKINWDSIQLEIGETATDYTAHEEQTFAMPIQQEMLEGDNFEKVDGVWKEKHNWKNITIKGDENIVATSDVTNRYRIQATTKDLIPLNHTTQKCTHIPNNRNWGTSSNSFDLRDFGQLYILVKDTTVEELKTKLTEDYANGTPLTVYFEVEPYYLACTEAQIEVLDEIERILHTYKGGTLVYGVDEISPIFNAKYTKDLNAVINNLSQQAIE